MKDPIFFSTEAYAYLLDGIRQQHSVETGNIFRNTFPDGEHYMRIDSNVKGREVVLVGGTVQDSDTMELFDLANGLVQQGLHSLKLVIPYFGYATMERAVQAGEIVTAKNRALLLSSLPHGPLSNTIYLMDLHSEGIPYYFEKEVRCKHLYCKKLIEKICRSISNTDFVLASTDAGRAKWVESLANDMQVASAFVYKQRLSGSETVISGVNANVSGKTVIIYDDMIRTGGSLMQAAAAYQKAGAGEIYAVATHGLFSNDALLKMKQQGLIRKVFCTDTHPSSLMHKSAYLGVYSVASLIFEALKQDGYSV